ncbi:MAG: hypothetical protein A2X97_02210 [Bdellovibrionales bacterium GWA1_52_35]|nr:MAG: hypothetical protein A2X97_02210 [Bdellovibrionales bacterium GWA1_52_35]
MRVLYAFSAFLSGLSALGSETPPVRLYLGFVTRIECVGSLKSSALGNPALAQVEAIPREMGCGLLLKPKKTGRSNLIVITGSGSSHRIVEVEGVERGRIKRDDLEVHFAPDPEGGAQ